MQFTESFIVEGEQNRAFDLLQSYVEGMKFKIKNLVRPNLLVFERGSSLGSVASTRIEDVKTSLMITLQQTNRDIEVACTYDVSVYGLILESDRMTLKTEVERMHRFLLTALNPPGISQNLPPPPPPPISVQPQKKKSPIGLIVVAIVALVAMVVLIGFFALPMLGVTTPKPEITMTQGREGLSGLNYVYYVDATVVNHGASGQVTVYAEISGAGRNEQQSTSIYLSKGESKTVTLTFDISLLGSLSNPSISYRAWASVS